MPLRLSEHHARSILTRTGGFLASVASHTAQPYRGCPLGGTLCGVGCYVRHNGLLLRGEPWGSFLEARVNAGECYAKSVARERRWARARFGRLGVFLSSSTEPFPPQERRFGATHGLLAAMLRDPPDQLKIQTHTDAVLAESELLADLATRCRLRVHVSVETDREKIADLPPHGCSVARRIEALAALRRRGLQTVATVSPLLPIADRDGFFRTICQVADAAVIDHFVGGDGTPSGSRTKRTPLPIAMERLEPGSTDLEYRDRIVRIARGIMPGRVGVGSAGFAGTYE